MKKTSGPVFLRDLKEELRKLTEQEIRKDRPDLVGAMEQNDDIQVGVYFYTSGYKVY
jgi:hypothetical protein